MSKGFDLKTHHIDKKTGRVVKKDPYRLRIIRGRSFYERGGKTYNPDGSLAGGVEPVQVGEPKKAPAPEQPVLKQVEQAPSQPVVSEPESQPEASPADLSGVDESKESFSSSLGL